MAITTTINGSVEHPHIGGTALSISIDWDGASPYARDTLYRLDIVYMNGASYTHAAYAYSGNPGGVNPFDLLAQPQDFVEHPAHLTVLVGYLPKLHPGIYYISPEYWNGAAWVAFGTSTPMQFQVLPAYRPREIYDIRQLWPVPPYIPGARNLYEEPMVEL